MLGWIKKRIRLEQMNSSLVSAFSKIREDFSAQKKLLEELYINHHGFKQTTSLNHQRIADWIRHFDNSIRRLDADLKVLEKKIDEEFDAFSTASLNLFKEAYEKNIKDVQAVKKEILKEVEVFMNENNAFSIIKELFENSEICCYLTTLNYESLPETRAMLNLRNRSLYPNLIDFFKDHDDDFFIYFSTNTSSPKVEQIKNNPNVCVYFSNPDEYKGCMLSGKINIVDDLNIKNSLWQDNWSIYYPGGKTDNDYTILELKPKLLKVYHQLGTFTIKKD